MTVSNRLVDLQTATPTPGVGPDELADYGPPVTRIGWFLVGFVVILLVGWYVVGPIIRQAIRRRNRNNPTIQEAITRYYRLLVIVVAFFVGAGVAGYGQFLANSALVIAAGTLAVGVAGQTVIGSLISGLVLVSDPEFNIGNYIEWDDGEGTVQSIALRITRVHTVDGKLVTIPNTVLTEQTITRPYGRKRRRIIEHVAVGYDDDLGMAIDRLEETANGLGDILSEPAPRAYVDDFGPDAVDIRVQYWIENPRQKDVLEIRSEFAQAVKSRLESADITISPVSKRALEGQIELQEPREL
ncbi:MAG: mechanosensitive ion channel family protein [Halobacteriales archaeon]